MLPTGENRVPKTLTIFLLAALSFNASAQTFHERFHEGNRLLRDGDHKGAETMYRDLLIDEPESDVLQYGLAASEYHKGLMFLRDGIKEDIATTFNKAADEFRDLAASQDTFVRKNVDYNIANAMALIAKNPPEDGKQEEVVAAFEVAILGYEEVLRKYPDHARAKKNLDHMRYLFKKMLQNPPQQQQGEGEESGEGDQDQPPSDQQQEQEQGQQDQQEQQQQDGQQSQQESSGAPNSQQAPDRQTIEAILESLEDLDKREQRHNRNKRTQVRILKNWW